MQRRVKTECRLGLSRIKVDVYILTEPAELEMTVEDVRGYCGPCLVCQDLVNGDLSSLELGRCENRDKRYHSHVVNGG